MHSEFRFRNFQILDISDVIKIYKTQKTVTWEPLRFSKINTDPGLLRNLQKEKKEILINTRKRANAQR